MKVEVGNSEKICNSFWMSDNFHVQVNAENLVCAGTAETGIINVFGEKQS